MQLDSGVRAALPVCSILLGFLFAGFWWTLNRELTFKVEDRHFKLGIGLLLVAMVMLGLFGVVLPLRAIAYANPAFLLDYRGVVLALITVFGYMLTDMGHYGVFKLPKYRTTTERFLFAATLLTVLGLISSEIGGSSPPKVAKFVAATCQALVTDRLRRAAQRCLFPSPQNS